MLNSDVYFFQKQLSLSSTGPTSTGPTSVIEELPTPEIETIDELTTSEAPPITQNQSTIIHFRLDPFIRLRKVLNVLIVVANVLLMMIQKKYMLFNVVIKMNIMIGLKLIVPVGYAIHVVLNWESPLIQHHGFVKTVLICTQKNKSDQHFIFFALYWIQYSNYQFRQIKFEFSQIIRYLFLLLSMCFSTFVLFFLQDYFMMKIYEQ